MDKCLTNNEIVSYCDMVNVEGSTPSQRCKNILKKISTKESCIRKSDLVKLVERLGLDSKGTKKDMIKKLKAFKGMSVSQEKKIVKDSVKKNVNEEKSESCIIFSVNNNFLITVPVPDKAFNKNHEWIPIRRTCYNVGFYRSSGSSNTAIGANFPGMWFPFYRIKASEPVYSGDKHRGWIWKAGTLYRKKSVTNYNNNVPLKMTDFLYVFFEKFEYWWQVQISAALPSSPDSLWNTHLELIELKAFCLQNSWDHGYGRFFKDPHIATFYHVGDCTRKVQTPEEVNLWLLEKNALCVDDRGAGIPYPKRKGTKIK
jgi:hypothetical protein